MMMETNCENLRSLSINDLIFGENDKRFCFIVPSYQRGYRWDKDQITKLLDDLLEFQVSKDTGDATVGNFYCLQPIVVKRMPKESVNSKLGDEYDYKKDTIYIEVIDGQQRLTTIYILLKYLQTRKSNVFELLYERDIVCEFKRKKLLEKLNSNTNPELLNPTIADEYYFVEAFKNIKNWFEEKESLLKTDTIYNNIQNTLEEKTKVIWYELPQDSSIDCYSVFKNINNGKIPLTDAELVKAMLLNRKYFSPKLTDNASNDKIIRQEQERYARLWDEIQHALSNDSLWAFITGGYHFNLPTRIDYLFKIAVTQQDPSHSQNRELSLFAYYEKRLNEKNNIEEKKKYIELVFDNIRKIYRTIQDWYNNHEIHNFIGYLMTYRGKDGQSKISQIAKYLKLYESTSRSDFIKTLKYSIKEDFKGYTLKSINYRDNGKKVEQLLMLFNIIELNAIAQKFNFSVDIGGWSIEHIKAQHSQIVNESDRKEYLQKELDRICKIESQYHQQYCNIKIAIESAINSNNLSDEEFSNIAENIDKTIDGFDEFDMHRLGNLALLSKNDNSAFNNSPFYEKRQKMLEWLTDPGKNIPYSTTKAFLKMYSVQDFSLDFTRWGKTDFDILFSLQTQCLKDYIQEDEQ